MTKKEEFYVIKMDITDENYYTYWRLWCTEEQAGEPCPGAAGEHRCRAKPCGRDPESSERAG